MRNFFESIRRQSRVRPFTTAIVVVLALVIPGFVRQEQALDTGKRAATSAKETADELEKERQLDAKRLERDELLSCTTRNTFQRNTRIKFGRFIDVIDLAFSGSDSQSPERQEATRAFINQLRGSVETKPEDEDRDCNNDGKYDEDDYLP